MDPVSGKPCYQCHRSKISGATVHGAVAGKECTPCHPTTGGNHQKSKGLYLPKDKSSKLCYECHEDQTKLKSVHPPIGEGDCLSCHAPHTSANKSLLRFTVPRLCFKCHDPDLVNRKETVKGTDFREGVQNLHFLHAKQNGIACATCHELHASPQSHLIRTKGKHGKEAVAIGYSVTTTGGSCSTSCHDTTGYQRK